MNCFVKVILVPFVRIMGDGLASLLRVSFLSIELDGISSSDTSVILTVGWFIFGHPIDRR